MEKLLERVGNSNLEVPSFRHDSSPHIRWESSHNKQGIIQDVFFQLKPLPPGTHNSGES